ncbi:MAG: site-specific integrase [Verrucomicrobiaceae bacterium]|nr:MAG: site-specific integrase [Verrucomicrobiaceae bacterium]
MMKLNRYLKLKRGIYYYQRRVPDDVRAIVPFAGMPIVYEVSLRTAVLNDALRALADTNEWFDQCLAAVRAGVSPPMQAKVAVTETMHPPDKKWAAYHGRRHYESIVDFTRSLELSAVRRESGAEERLEDWHVEIAGMNSRAEALDAGAFEVMRKEALRVFEEERRIEPLPPPRTLKDHRRRHPVETSNEFLQLCEQLGRAEIEVRAHFRAIEASPVAYQLQTPSLRDAPRTLGEASKFDVQAITKLVVAAASSKGEDWRFRLQRAADIWLDFGLPTDVREIKKSHVIDYVEQLLKCPVNMKQRFPSLKWSTAIIANSQQKWPTIGAGSVRDTYLAPLKQIFTYAVERELIDRNPASRVNVAGSKRKKSQRGTSFNGGELNELFKLPMFVGCQSKQEPLKPGRVLLDDHRFWGPLVALFTGARTTEIAQLKIAEVLIDTDTPHFLIQSDAERRVKTDAGLRMVPIHRSLIAIGFSQYVRRLRKRGATRLFPEWENPNGSGYAESSSQRHFKRTIIPKISARLKPRPNFHSFRHTMKDAMANAGVPPQHQNAMLGHEQDGQDVNYLHGLTVEALTRSMAKIEFEGLRLDHLFGTRG